MDLFDDLFNNDMRKLIQSFKLSWQRPFSERDGYGVTKSKDHDGSFIVFNTLGVDPKDISVDFKRSKDDYGNNGIFITVKGETIVEPLHVKYSVNNTIFYPYINGNPVEKLQYTSANGLTIVYAKSKLEDNSLESAKKIEDGDEFDW